MTSEQIQAINKARQEVKAAKGRNSGLQAAKEKMKNLLFNYCDDIVRLTADYQKLQQERDALSVALDEMDLENDELRKRLKAAESKQKKGNTENEEHE